MTYPQRFREQVLKIREREQLSYEETAHRFSVGIASIVRWGRRVEPKLKRVKAATKIDMEALAQDVQAHPEAYQYERAQRFGVSQRGIGCALRRLKISYKKNTSAPPRR